MSPPFCPVGLTELGWEKQYAGTLKLLPSLTKSSLRRHRFGMANSQSGGLLNRIPVSYQVQELHRKLSEESRRADNLAYEKKKFEEKHDTLMREKEVQTGS